MKKKQEWTKKNKKQKAQQFIVGRLRSFKRKITNAIWIILTGFVNSKYLVGTT